MKPSVVMSGIRAAMERNATSVTIDGETWTRQPTQGAEAKLAAARMKVSELYTERDILQAAMLEARDILGRQDARCLEEAANVLAKPLGLPAGLPHLIEPNQVEY